MLSFAGTPAAIGRAYGEQCRDRILANLKILVYRVGHPALPRQEPDFLGWLRRQEDLLTKHWPWLLAEMHGVAQGAGVQYEDILLLNLRAWQFEYYGATPKLGGCSSLAITLADGTVAAAGALDDPAEYYCGPVRFAPEQGFSFVTFPITGTSWGSRGMNSCGLVTGISSQLLPGLRSLPHAVNQDLALRVILQTCRTVAEVREFCRAFPFTMNLVVVDAHGGILCAQNTTAGLFELPAPGYCALTNHVADDRFRQWLGQRGVTDLAESPTSVPRRECLLSFAKRRNGKCSLTEVMEVVGRRDDGNPGTVHNRGSICLTVANPQVAARTLWIRQPQAPDNDREFQPCSIDA